MCIRVFEKDLRKPRAYHRDLLIDIPASEQMRLGIEMRVTPPIRMMRNVGFALGGYQNTRPSERWTVSFELGQIARELTPLRIRGSVPCQCGFPSVGAL